MSVGKRDQILTWLQEPESATVTVFETVDKQPWEVFADEVWAEIKNMPPSRSGVGSAGQTQETYRVTHEELEGLNKNHRARWNLGGGDKDLYLQIESMQPPQRTGTQVMICVACPNPDVVNHAAPPESE